MATMTTSTEPVAGVPPPTPSGTVLASFTLSLSQTVTFKDWHPLLTTITLPSNIPTAGHSLREYGYDVTTGVIGQGSNPGTVSGTVISFGDDLGDVSLLGNHTYLVVLVMTS